MTKKLYMACVISIIWKFSKWLKLIFLLSCLGILGVLSIRLSNFLGSCIPSCMSIWILLAKYGGCLVSFCKSAIAYLAVFYLILFSLAEIFGVRVIRSSRISRQLKQMLLNDMDKVPSESSDKRISADSISKEKANMAISHSFVLVARHEAVAFVRIPAQVQVRKNIEESLNIVADDLSSLLNLKSSAWLSYRGTASFDRYKIMNFK